MNKTRKIWNRLVFWSIGFYLLVDMTNFHIYMAMHPEEWRGVFWYIGGFPINIFLAIIFGGIFGSILFAVYYFIKRKKFLINKS